VHFRKASKTGTVVPLLRITLRKDSVQKAGVPRYFDVHSDSS